MWREADYLRPRALLGYFPCYGEGNEIVVLDPEDRTTVLERLVAPRQPVGDRLCLADFFRPRESGDLDVVALQAVTAGDEVTELMARLERDGEFAEQLFTHGIGVQTAEGMAEWLHWRVRARPRPPRDAGAPVLVGLSGHPRAVRAREGLPAAGRDGADRAAALRRLRGRARAVHAGPRRPSPGGDLLRHDERAPAARGPPRAPGRRHQGLAARSLALRRARRRRPGARRGRRHGAGGN